MSLHAFGHKPSFRHFLFGRINVQRWLRPRLRVGATTSCSRFQHSLPSFHMERDTLFNYTSGRWIYNEPLRKSERSLRFDLLELQRLAAESIHQKPEDVVLFEKLAEGGFNRVFQMSMRDGFQLIIRIPYPTTAPKRFAVASEVATIDFLRSHNIPVPKVYAYSATSENAAGVEYIIMEMLKGRQVGDRWYSMTEEQRMKIIFQIARIEGQLFSIPLPASGSIYYSDDLESSIPRHELPDSANSDHFCIGPATNLKLWYRERSTLSINRGPFTTPEHAFKAGAIKEKAYLKKYGHDRHIQKRLCREVFDYQKQSPLPYLNHLENFLLIGSHISPSKDSILSQPVIRHPDLNPNNIFVSESFDIVGLIDWQHCSILPLFLQSGIPAYFQNYGDDDSESLVQPNLPKNFTQLDEGEQAVALEIFRKRQMHYYYMAATVKHNSIHFDALWEDFGMFKQRIFDHASSPWEGDNVTLMTDLIEATQRWSKIAVPAADGTIAPCPISYSEEEVAECRRTYQKLKEMDEQEESMIESLGVGHDGWVPNERYEESKELNAKMKAYALEFAESELEREMLDRHWPFDDQDEQE